MSHGDTLRQSPQLGDFAVDVADAATDLGVIHDKPLPALSIGSGRRLQGNFEALADQAHRHDFFQPLLARCGNLPLRGRFLFRLRCGRFLVFRLSSWRR